MIRYNEAVAGIERLQIKRDELAQEVKLLEKQLETRQTDLERERRRYDNLKNDIARLLALSGHLEDKEDRTNAIKAIVGEIFSAPDSEHWFDTVSLSNACGNYFTSK